jgi:hypothetical protein
MPRLQESSVEEVTWGTVGGNVLVIVVTVLKRRKYLVSGLFAFICLQ